MNVNDILQNKWTIPAAVGIVALSGGFGAGYILGKKAEAKNWTTFDVPEYKEEDDVVVETTPPVIYEDETEQVIETAVEVPQPMMERYRLVVEEYKSSEDVIPDNEDDIPEPVVVTRRVFQDADDDQWVYEDELAARSEGREMYVIHYDEFMANESDYNQETLTYYAGDDIVVDQTDTPVHNHRGLMGELKFGHGSGDANVVYIRNDKIHMEWEILRSEGSYEIEVLGHTIEAEYDKADLKHSHERRFRPD